MLAHGFGEGVADGEAFGLFAVPCRRELAVAFLAADVPIASSAGEMTPALDLPVFAAPPVPAAPPASAPVTDVVSAGFGVVLGLTTALSWAWA